MREKPDYDRVAEVLIRVALRNAKNDEINPESEGSNAHRGLLPSVD